MTPEEIARGLTALQADALKRCCDRGGTRTNDGWIVKWNINPTSRVDGYINLYTAAPLGLAVREILKGQNDE
jgi:hypothetical protein